MCVTQKSIEFQMLCSSSSSELKEVSVDEVSDPSIDALRPSIEKGASASTEPNSKLTCDKTWDNNEETEQREPQGDTARYKSLPSANKIAEQSCVSFKHHVTPARLHPSYHTHQIQQWNQRKNGPNGCACSDSRWSHMTRGRPFDACDRFL